MATRVSPCRAPAVALAVALLLSFAPVSAHAAAVWLPPTTVSEAGQNAYDPQMAIDSAGNTTAVWYRSDGAKNLVQAATRANGGSWSPATTLSVPGQHAYHPQIAVAASGVVTALWYRFDGSHDRIQAATRSTDGNWSAPVSISDAGETAHSPQIAVNAAGELTVVWCRNDGSHDRVQSARKPAGGDWGTPATLSDPGQNAMDPQVVVDAAGNATAAWRRSDGVNARVQVATRTAGGAWSAPVDLSAAGQDAYSPQMVVDATGVTTAAWERMDGARIRIQSAQRPATGVWSATTDLSDPGENAFGAQIDVGSDNAVYAVWRRSDGMNFRVQAAVKPAGDPWGSPTTLSDAGLDAARPELTVDSAGNATAVWQRSDGVDDRIQASLRPSGGAWGSPTTLSAAGQTSANAEIAVDSAGNATVMWHRFDGARYRIQAAGLDVVGPIITALPTAATAGTPLAFTTSIVDAWSGFGAVWDFGDGGTSTSVNPTHTFAEAGTRTVTVTATDAVGNVTVRTGSVVVSAAPPTPPPTPPAPLAPPGPAPAPTPKPDEAARTSSIVVAGLRLTLTTPGSCVQGGTSFEASVTAQRLRTARSAATVRSVEFRQGRKVRTLDRSAPFGTSYPVASTQPAGSTIAVQALVRIDRKGAKSVTGVLRATVKVCAANA